MDITLVRKSGHKFFRFADDGVVRTVCVDGWINSNICPGFCSPSLQPGWEPLPDDMSLRVVETSLYYEVFCPTCFGYLSARGSYRKVGNYHTVLSLDKSGLHQYLYNYTIL